MIRTLTAAILALSLMASPVHVRAEETASEVPASDTSIADEMTPEMTWRKELKQEKKAQSRTKKVGIGATLTGLALILVGSVRSGSSEDVGGCERDGSKVRCDSESGRNEAQDRIDQGRSIMVAGLLTGLVGVGCLVSGANRSKKIDALERKGRREGYKLSLAPDGTDGVQILVSRSF